LPFPVDQSSMIARLCHNDPLLSGFAKSGATNDGISVDTLAMI